MTKNVRWLKIDGGPKNFVMMSAVLYSIISHKIPPYKCPNSMTSNNVELYYHSRDPFLIIIKYLGLVCFS